MNQWLSEAANRIAAASGVPREELELAASDIAALLDDAGFAAHESGQRTNAPLLCYLLGVAVGRGGDREELRSAVRHVAVER